MGRSGGRSSGGRSSGGRAAPSYFGSAPSRSSHTSASASSAAAPVRTATPSQHTAPPPALAPAHPPAAYQQQHQQPAMGGGGGMLSGLAGTVMQGMAFGGGSAMAHRAVDSIAGPRTVVHDHQGGAAAESAQSAQSAAAASTAMSAIDTGDRKLNRAVEAQCGEEVGQFTRCLQERGNDFQQCSFYFDVLSQCQKAVKENAQWQ